MKAVAEINKTAKFLRGGGCHGTGIKHAVISNHPDSMPVEARKTRDQAGAEFAAHLEKAGCIAVAINDMGDDFAHLKRLAPVGRHNIGKRVFASVYRVIAGNSWRPRPCIVGQVRQKPRDLVQCVFFVFCQIVNGTAF